MKTNADIIHKEPKPAEPPKPRISSVIIVSAGVYLIYLICKAPRFSSIDLCLVLAFTLALAVLSLIYFRKIFLKKKNKH